MDEHLLAKTHLHPFNVDDLDYEQIWLDRAFAILDICNPAYRTLYIEDVGGYYRAFVFEDKAEACFFDCAVKSFEAQIADLSKEPPLPRPKADYAFSPAAVYVPF